MRGLVSFLVKGSTLLLLCVCSLVAAADQKEWTFMVFLNGNNNLDSYGSLNINQLETVGSSDKVNFVVQWASLDFTTTKRLLVQKDADKDKVTSPIVAELPRVDMGDYKALVEFMKWTIQNYPAKHYFLDLWNHGSGWHRKDFRALDISFDDFSGHAITTAQLGLAMAEVSQYLGRKIDIVGSDACLMAMLEVGEEMADSVDVAVASEETEPALGWPYHLLADWWVKNPTATPAEVGKTLTKQYVDYIVGAGLSGATLSAVDLKQSGKFVAAVSAFADLVKRLGSADTAKVVSAVSSAQSFAYRDYVDLGDLLDQIQAAGISAVGAQALSPLRDTLKSYVIANHTSDKYGKAQGISMWVPTSKSTYDQYSTKYAGLKFARSNWGGALEWVLKN